MARTNATSSTSTFVRMLTIKNQYKIAFKRLMGYSDQQCQPFLEAIHEKKIDYISFWSSKYNSKGVEEKWCELTIYVDWEKHRSYLLSGKDKVTLKKVWDGVLPEVGSAIDIVEEMNEEYGLHPTFSVGFNHLDSEEYNKYMRKLGLVKSRSVKWKDNVGSTLKTIINERPKELDELRVEIRVSDRLY